MKFLHHKLGVLLIASAPFVSSALATSVHIDFSTTAFYDPPEPGQAVSADIAIYDRSATYFKTVTASGYAYDDGNGGVYGDISLDTDLPPGGYSFGIYGTYFTDILSVGSTSLNHYFPLEAFAINGAPLGPFEPIDNNLLVRGGIDMEGGFLNMGTNPSNPSIPPFSLRIEGGTFLSNASSLPSPTWRWTNLYGRGMQLTSNATSATLTVNNYPVLTTAGAGSQFLPAQPVKLAVGSSVSALGALSGAFGLGTTAQGYNQFVVGQYNTLLGGASTTEHNDPLFIVGNGQGTSTSQRSNAFLVERDGDTKIAGKLIVGNGASAADGTIAAMGQEAQAYGYGSMALGQYAISEGGNSFAMGLEAIASGDNSLAFGADTAAWGIGSVCIGGYSSTGGTHSIVAGWYSYANAQGSIALGEGVQANANNQVVLGRYNVSSGSPSVEAPSDAVLIVGNGTASNQSNALTVRRDSGTAIGKGVESAREAQIVVGKFNDTQTNDNGTDHTQGIFVVGNGTAQANRKNAVRVVEQNGQTLVLIQKAGDIDMGEFQGGPRP
jgi:Head domain of trimeric autotransporter adhesin